MIRNFFRKKGDSELNKNNQEHEAEIVDLAEEASTAEAEELARQQETEQQQAQEKPVDDVLQQTDLMNKLVRLQADFDNYRKRTATGRAEARDEARREVLLDLLPIYDNFLRALGHAEEVEDYGSLRAGIQGILQQMREFLNRQGLQEIPSDTGTPFDPNRHDAVGTVPGTSESHHTIAQEVLKGFELNGNVVRPAQVLVYTGE